MSLKNLNAQNKTHKILLNKLKDKRILKIYKKFEKDLNLNSNFIVAISGGPDSIALSFLTKIYSIKNFLNVKYYIVDHKLRNNSTFEAKNVQKHLKPFSINLNILTWKGVKPKKNIQSIARNKRYELLVDKAKRLRIEHILLGHHLDDLFENFFIRLLRGSGLNGLVSLDKETQRNKVNLVRPLINFDKNDLIYICNHVFGFYVEDPSNQDIKFKRVKVRNFLKQLALEGLDRKKFILTIKNLKFANENIKFYVQRNLKKNVTFTNTNNAILAEDFFIQSDEVVFRSLAELLKLIGKKYYHVRGKKIDNIIDLIKHKSSFKVTLGGCLIKKINRTVILLKE
jgi:tRNA(Ile)-lysidine synthase